MFDVIFSVALALIFARGLGYLFERYKQPAVIGEIIAGLILGAIGLMVFYGQQLTFFNLTVKLPELAYNTPEFELLAELGILFLLSVVNTFKRLPLFTLSVNFIPLIRDNSSS